MALTRKSLKAMGLTDEQVDSIVEMHSETVDGLKDKLKTAEEKAEKLDSVQKELDGLKAKGGNDYEAKYKAVKKEFDDYKADINAKETKAAKEAAVKAYFEGKKITGGNLSIAMRGARDEIAGIELDENGKIKDTASLDALIGGEYAALVVTTETRGARTETPPSNNGGKSYKTKEEILAIKDRAERQTAIAENHEMFGF